MKIQELENKKILILGYGLEGKATEKFLKEKVPNAVYEVADQKFDQHYLTKQKDFDLIIKTPVIHKSLVTKPYTTGTNIFFANVSNVIIGVTGSKGKSTTTSLIYCMLKEAGKKVSLVGNIGKPMILELLRPIDPDEIFVCELSSYQLDDIKYSPHISVVTSLFPEHMNYHGSIDAYYEAKRNIIHFQTEKDYFVYNSDFLLLNDWAKEAKSQTIPFIHKDEVRDWKTNLLGEHNKSNITGAVTAARILGLQDDVCKKAVENFEPLPHRLEFVGEFKCIKFYNDALATTPEATLHAINALDNISTIMLGGEDRGYDFVDLTQFIAQSGIKNIVLFPESGKTIKRLLQITGVDFNFFETTSMEEAVKFAYKYSPSGTTCLLSTASPSYSIWKNYEEKGNLFKEFVKKYQ